MFPDITQGKLVLPSTLGTSSFPQTVRRGYIESYNFTIQRDMGHGFNVQAGYVGTMSIRQFASVNINASTPEWRQRRGATQYPLWQHLHHQHASTRLIRPGSIRCKPTAVKRFRGGNAVRMSHTFGPGDRLQRQQRFRSCLELGSDPQQQNKALAGYDRTHNFKLLRNLRSSLRARTTLG